MKKILFLFLLCSQLFAIDKTDLLEKAIIEQATTPDQKKIVEAYIAEVVRNKEKEIVRLNERANSTRGGKIISQNLERQELIFEANKIKKEIQELLN